MDAAGSLPLFASIPFDGPRARTGRDVLHDVKAGIDFVAHNLPPAHRVLVRLNPYPRPWRSMHVETADGARLAAWYGAGRPGGPSILFAPGTFQTKDDTPRKRRAIDLWRRLGASVLILDLRGFGGSYDSAGSAGYLEARDLHVAADRLLEESHAERAVLWGESLGGAVSLISAALPGAESRFSKVIAWSPYADLADASAVADPTTDVGRSILGKAYRWLLRHRTSYAVDDFRSYLELCAGNLGLTTDELLWHGSPMRHASRLRVPSVVIHAEDDHVVPVWHAEVLRECRSDKLDVHVVPRGGHLDFDRIAPQWYDSATRNLLTGAAL